MRNHKIAKVGIAAAVVICAATASAQSSPTGISPRIGTFIPTSGGEGSGWFAFGADIKLGALPSMGGNTGFFGLSGDYYSRGGESNLPVALTYNLRSSGFLYSVGVGVDFYNLQSVGGTGTGLGGQLGVAYDIVPGPLPVYLQAKYFLASKSDLQGFGLYVGVRF